MSHRAFTLIELVLVTLVLAILLVVAIPSFQRSSRRFFLEQRAFEWAHLLRYARQRAVTEGQPVVWVWDSSNRRVHLETVGEDGRSIPLEERTSRSAQLALPASVTIASNGDPIDCACVRFFPDGTADGAAISMADEGNVYNILVDAQTGQATLTAGAAAR